jgi:uncharacterized damage-inducible protein DinB
VESNSKILCATLERALSGKGSHAATRKVLDGLDWKNAGVRPDGAPHSVFQLANHMIYWQEWVVKWLDGESPKVPKHARGSWPGRVTPASRKEWEQIVRRFLGSLDALERRSRAGDPLTKHGKKTHLEMLHSIASHNSYHAGQVAFLRQLLGTWPPPSGGVTW